MMEYTTVLILIFLTYIVAIINIKFPILGFLVTLIDLIVFLPEPLTSGLVIIGYTLSGSIATPITQTFSWLTIVIITGMVLCISTALLRMSNRI